MLSKNIKKMRRVRGLSQGALGEKIGLKHSTIAGYESGRTVPTADILEDVAKALDIPIEVLLKAENPEFEIDAKTTEEKERDSAMRVIEKQQDMLMEQQKTISKLVDIIGRNND
jgi:transcriptional regulator with XRE-family HTH domain